MRIRAKILSQRAELRAIADSAAMALLRGTELNIAPDGTVDWDRDFLSGFDICVISVQTETRFPKILFGWSGWVGRPRKLWAIIEESAFRRWLGPGAVMRPAQVSH